MDYEGMIYVYELPEKMAPPGFRFNGPAPVQFANIDFMNNPPADFSDEQLRRFVLEKRYTIAGKRYLILSQGGVNRSIIVEP